MVAAAGEPGKKTPPHSLCASVFAGHTSITLLFLSQIAIFVVALGLLSRFTLRVLESKIMTHTSLAVLYFAMFAACRDTGVEIAFPQRDLHLRSISEEAAEVLLGTFAGSASKTVAVVDAPMATEEC